MSKQAKKRNPSKTWENKLDAIFSKVIRKAGCCARCYKTENLQCSHIHSRTKMAVRWDLHNAMCLCSGCHKYWWHMHPIDAAEFAKQYLGAYNYEQLNWRANTLKVNLTIDDMKSMYERLKSLYEETP